MRKFFVLFVLIASISCFFACKKDNNTVLIEGKWAVTKTISTTYVDNVVASDSTWSTPASFTNYLQFDKNGPFTAVFGNTSLDTITGTYKVSGTALTFSDYHTNFNNIPTLYTLFFDGLPGDGIPASEISTSNQIIQITSTSLTIHTEVTTRTDHTFKSVMNLYCTKQ